MQKVTYKSIPGRMAKGRMHRSERHDGNTIVAAIFWVGITLVFAFLLWTFTMVFLQALDRWHK